MKKYGRSTVALSILVETTKLKFPADFSVSRNSFSTARPRGRFASRRSSQPGPPKIGGIESMISVSLLYAKRLMKSYIKLIRTSHLARAKRGLILSKGYPVHPVGSMKIRGKEVPTKDWISPTA